MKRIDVAELDKYLQVGCGVRVLVGPDKTPSRLQHVRAVVDEEHMGNDTQIVTCEYAEKRWLYKIESRYYYELLAKDDRLIAD